MADPIPWLIILPLVWASLAFLLGSGRGRLIAAVSVIVQLILTIILADQILSDGPRIYAVGGWGASLGIDLYIDGLSSIMLLLTQVIIVPLIIYSRAYFSKKDAANKYFWPLTGYLLAAMNALFMSADLFNIYVTLELLGLAAVGLVAAVKKTVNIAAAMRYLLVALLGSGSYLLGVALIYGNYGTVSIEILAPLIISNAPTAISLAAILMLLGLLLKTGLFPFHFWLPPAHGGAPAPVSALLSALVIKASFYLILRLWLDLFTPLVVTSVAQILGLLGSIAILWGSYKALQQTRLKMLVAYSTVAQIGYLFLLFPLIAYTNPAVTEIALQGGMMHVITHALAKTAMFAAAGTMVQSMGRDSINYIGGVSNHLPLTFFAFTLAGITLMGLPPSGGFTAKWLLISAALKSGQWIWVMVIISGGLLTAAYVFKVLHHAFLPPQSEIIEFKLALQKHEWPAFLLALVSIVLGIRSYEVLSLLGAE